MQSARVLTILPFSATPGRSCLQASRDRSRAEGSLARGLRLGSGRPNSTLVLLVWALGVFVVERQKAVSDCWELRGGRRAETRTDQGLASAKAAVRCIRRPQSSQSRVCRSRRRSPAGLVRMHQVQLRATVTGREDALFIRRDLRIRDVLFGIGQSERGKVTVLLVLVLPYSVLIDQVATLTR